MAEPPPSIPHSSKQVVEQSYDKIASTYLQWTTSHQSPRTTYLHKVLSLLPSSSNITVLELGCGAGVPCTQILAQHAKKLVAVDISATQIELAKQNVNSNGEGGAEIEFVKSDMHALTFAPETFDAVLGFYSIIHLPKEEQVVMMKRIWSWLKDGGYFLANFAAGEPQEGTAESWLVEGSGMFWSSWGEKGNLEMVTNAGFEVIVSDVIEDDEGEGKKVKFVWILARKQEGGDGKVV